MSNSLNNKKKKEGLSPQQKRLMTETEELAARIENLSLEDKENVGNNRTNAESGLSIVNNIKKDNVNQTNASRSKNDPNDVKPNNVLSERTADGGQGSDSSENYTDSDDTGTTVYNAEAYADLKQDLLSLDSESSNDGEDETSEATESPDKSQGEQNSPAKETRDDDDQATFDADEMEPQPSTSKFRTEAEKPKQSSNALLATPFVEDLDDEWLILDEDLDLEATGDVDQEIVKLLLNLGLTDLKIKRVTPRDGSPAASPQKASETQKAPTNQKDEELSPKNAYLEKVSVQQLIELSKLATKRYISSGVKRAKERRAKQLDAKNVQNVADEESAEEASTRHLDASGANKVKNEERVNKDDEPMYLFGDYDDDPTKEFEKPELIVVVDDEPEKNGTKNSTPFDEGEDILDADDSSEDLDESYDFRSGNGRPMSCLENNFDFLKGTLFFLIYCRAISRK